MEVNYNIVLVLPYINMNPPQVYMCFPSWTCHTTFDTYSQNFQTVMFRYFNWNLKVKKIAVSLLNGKQTALIKERNYINCILQVTWILLSIFDHLAWETLYFLWISVTCKTYHWIYLIQSIFLNYSFWKASFKAFYLTKYIKI